MLITKDLIVLSLEGTNKESIIEALADKAVELGRVNDKGAYVQAVLGREAEYSTAVGFGVAIPHGKTDAVSEPFLAYGKVNAIDWNAMDGEPVYNVFLIGVPEKEAGNTHLQILAKLSRKLMKKDFREALEGAADESAVLELLKTSEIL